MRKWKLGCLPLMILFIPLLFMLGVSGNKKGFTQVTVSVKSNLSPNVLRYKSDIEKYAGEQDIRDYVPYLLAIMQVESGGNGEDPMQSSESIDGNIGNIKNPTDSIKQGTIHFKKMLDRATAKGSDIWAVVQSYNYGAGFIDFLDGQNWSFEKAEEFSRKYANGEKVRYVNDISTAKGYDYRYNYGNMFYVLLVQKYLMNSKGYDGTFVLPMDNPKITSWFGEHRNLILQDGRTRNDVHNGVDFVNGNPKAEIRAVAGGTVVFADWSGGAGLAVVIKHSDELYTHYYHFSSINVQLNDTVSQNQVLGIIGTTGDSTGIHLHFGVSKQMWAEHFDPLEILPAIE